MDLGQQRAVYHRQQAADLVISENTLKVVNLTGHKLITGYPEGRRMWLNIRWFDNGVEMTDQETGAWGELPTTAVNPTNTSATLAMLLMRLSISIRFHPECFLDSNSAFGLSTAGCQQ